jgi:hypothetical protein
MALAAPRVAQAAACPNEALRYGYGAYLPDCRAYEQATPIDKDGTNPKSAWFAVQAAEDGSGVTFFSQAGVPGGDGAGSLPTYASFRGAAGWATRGLLPPATAGQRGSVFGWTPDLTEWFNTVTRFGSGTGTFARTMSDGALHTIAPFVSTNNPSYNFVGASSDGSKVYIEASGVELTSGAAPEKQNLYVWDRETGAVSLVGVLPDSACGSPPCTPAGGSFGGSYNWWTNELATFGGAQGRYFTQYQHAISGDGSKAYFTAGETGQLYLRENATSPAATTVHVSASQKTNGTGPAGTDPEGPKPAAFLAATPDGSKAFFMSSEKLTNDATTGPTDEGRDLYRYEPGTGRLTDLTPDPGDPNGAEVQGLVGTSTDGSYIYFAANGDLDGAGPAVAGNCDHGGPGANSGECSLYLWHEGDISFVARLDTSGEVGGIVAPGRSDLIDWAPTGREASSTLLNGGRVSADGQVVLFRSQRKLTSYDNHGVPEYYRYDARSGALDCVTCNPSGAAPSGQPNLQARTAFVQVNSWAAVTTRNLSGSGDRFFFETPDALLPGDTDGVEDVYEWEADGAGSCQSTAEDGGCLYLLSTGKSPEASHLADASVSGDDVFIFTDQPLVGQDEDELVDIYDARVDGGLASQNPQRIPPCSGEGCRGSSTRAPGTDGAGSSVFSGPGNQAPGGACVASRRIGRLHRHAAALRHRSRALTARARHARDARQARGLKRRARRLSKGAQVLNKRADGLGKRCSGAGSNRQRGSHRRGGSR